MSNYHELDYGGHFYDLLRGERSGDWAIFTSGTTSPTGEGGEIINGVLIEGAWANALHPDLIAAARAKIAEHRGVDVPDVNESP